VIDMARRADNDVFGHDFVRSSVPGRPRPAARTVLGIAKSTVLRLARQ